MAFLGFFIAFVIAGYIIGKAIPQYAVVTIVMISIGWAIPFGPWAIATLIELLLGYALSRK